jgi:glutamate-ammonia-ligase adenylyltransferase
MGPLADRIARAPRPHDPAPAAEAAALFADQSEPARDLLAGTAGCSGYLGGLMRRDPDWLRAALAQPPETTFAAILDELPVDGDPGPALRLAKRRAALLIALADLGGVWDLDAVTGALTALADRAVQTALTAAVAAEIARGRLPGCAPEYGASGAGMFVLAMGKMGAGELNYSSDIDLIVLYEPTAIDYRGRRDVHDFCQRLTRDLIQLMSERRAEGYVFRTDLRLRPDPGATPIALPYGAAMVYYESMGQNWERAAMIKARPVAGDLALGRQFRADVRPFIWRKSLDFLAIQDIHSIKRQINAVKGGARIAIEGHNVKLGRGGIREIEFFAQTQQLIWGGRDPTLRSPRTKAALVALASAGHTDMATVNALCDAYDFLRQVEHRLQMAQDQQTQILPADARGIAELAEFLHYDSEEAFRAALLHHLHTVEDHYAHLFEEAPSLGGGGNLVFTGGEPEPDTVETLTQLGFKSPATVFNLVKSWHHGRYRAMRSQRARELLTEIMPTLLAAFGRTADPDAALAKFDEFLGGLPAGVQLFGLLAANPRLLDLIAEVMGTAPGLAQQLSRRPGLLDAVLSRGFFERLPDRAALAAELEARMTEARDYQDRLDIARSFANDRRFQAGIHQLQALSEEKHVAGFLTDLADVVLTRLLADVTTEYALTHGRLPGAGLAVLALGKLGSREMAAGSDLDLVILYDAPEGAMSDGPRPHDAMTWTARLAQRFVNALTLATGEGQLYQADLRLRPSGNAGPIAITLEGFRRYHEKDAWTWERMALTRARVVVAEPGFAQQITATLHELMARPLDPAKLLRDVHDMRQRLHRDKPAKGPWDVKMRAGGLVDCEFIAQYLALLHAHAHPQVLAGPTDRVLQALAAARLMEPGVAERLAQATRQWRRVQGYLRLTAPADFDHRSVPEPIRTGLAKAAGALDFARLEASLEATAAFVGQVYRDVVAAPAEALPPKDQP